jgi:hypothetical protein
MRQQARQIADPARAPSERFRDQRQTGGKGARIAMRIAASPPSNLQVQGDCCPLNRQVL